jgi:CDP-2,3-bis-(O-geranylgeranyl)-sn-glycerol synthase
MTKIFIDTFILLISCGVINISLNLFYITKKKYGVERWDTPFDFGLHLGKNRILGQSTTWGGLVVSLGLGALIQLFFMGIPGIVIGIGCFFGHALGSFIKRRLSIPRGAYLPVVDHGDYIIVTGFLLLCMHWLSFETYLMSICIILLIHPLFCFIGYKRGFRDHIL